MRPGVPGAVRTPRTELAYRFPGLRPYRDGRRVRQPGRSAGWTGRNLGPFGINDLTYDTFARARTPLDAVEDTAVVARQKAGGGDLMLPHTVGSRVSGISARVPEAQS